MKTIMIDGEYFEVADDDPHISVYVEPVPVPTVTGVDVISALSDAQASKAKLRDLVRLAVDPNVPVTNAKLVRIASAVGMTPADLFTAASGS